MIRKESGEENEIKPIISCLAGNLPRYEVEEEVEEVVRSKRDGPRVSELKYI